MSGRLERAERLTLLAERLQEEERRREDERLIEEAHRTEKPVPYSPAVREAMERRTRIKNEQRKQDSRPLCTALLWVLSFLLLAGLTAALVAFSPEFPSAPFCLLTAAALFLLEILIHETGHLLSGWIMGCRFRSIEILRFRLEKEQGRLRLRFETESPHRGCCCMEEPPYPGEKEALAAERFRLAGGMLLQGFFALLAALLFLRFPRSPAAFGLLLFVYFSLQSVVFNLLPHNRRSLQSDGDKLWALRHDPDCRATFLWDYQRRTGIRPRECLPPSEAECNVLYWYWYALDGGAPAAIADRFALLEREALAKPLSDPLTTAYGELLYYYGVLQPDSETAGLLLRLIGRERLDCPSSTARRFLAGAALSAGQTGEAAAFAREGIEAAEKQPGNGLCRMDGDLLRALLARIGQAAPEPPSPFPQTGIAGEREHTVL